MYVASLPCKISMFKKSQCSRRKQTLCAVSEACLTNSDDNVGTGFNPAGDTSRQYFGWGRRQREHPRQYYYVLSDIADQYWFPSVRSASSRFHSAVRRVFPSHTTVHSVVRPANLELALTPLSTIRLWLAN